LEKSQTENKKLNSELATLKTITSVKSSSSEYIDVNNYISSTKEIRILKKIKKRIQYY